MEPIRLLEASEIECRAAQVGANKDGKVWVSLLLYKDARVDMRILDEVFGPMGWQRRHEIIEGRLYCTVSIWDDRKNEWIDKQDVGTESNTEKEKGQASDAFKRACFNVGIGRELYTAPKIFVWLEQGEFYSKKGPDGKERYYCTASFSIPEGGIGYDEKRNISYLVITDKSGKVRYQLGQTRQDATQAPAAPPAPTKRDFPDNTEHTMWKNAVRRIAEGEPGVLDNIKANFNITQAQIHTLNNMVENYKINNNLK